jgi:hypothetical protein
MGSRFADARVRPGGGHGGSLQEVLENRNMTRDVLGLIGKWFAEY